MNDPGAAAEAPNPCAPPTSRVTRGAAAFVGLTGATAAFVVSRAGNIDDAFIVLAYAQNALLGRGLVWNEQEGAVDGFTSSLDLALKVLGTLLSPSDPLAAAWWITFVATGVAGALAGLLAVEGTSCRGRGAIALALGGALAAASSPALGEAAAFLLEGPLFCAVALMGVFGAVSPPRGVGGAALWGGLLALLAFTRPEGIVASVLLLALRGLLRPDARQPRDVVVAASVFATLSAAHLLARRFTFGAWAPNTYFAKTSASRWNELADGARYLAAFASTPHGALVVFVGVLAALLLATAPAAARPRAVVAGLGLAFATTLLVVVEGGDSYSGARFLAFPSLAIPAVGVVAARCGLSGPRSRWRVAVAVTVVVAGGLLLVFNARTLLARYRVVHRFGGPFIPLELHESFRCDLAVAGYFLRSFPDAVFAESDFQRLKFLAPDLRVVDLSGLNDRGIAHEPVWEPVRFGKFSFATALRLAPDFWIYGDLGGLNPRPLAQRSVAELADDPAVWRALAGVAPSRPEDREALVAQYTTASVPACGHFFNLLVKRSIAPRARAAGMLVHEERAAGADRATR